jgi:hypothetical protein
MPFLSGADLLALRSLSEAFIVVGSVGLVSQIFNDRRLQRRWLALLFVLVTASGVALFLRIDHLQAADRDLTDAQQIALRDVVSRFSGVEFVVETLRDDSEAQSLARKIADAVTPGTRGQSRSVDEIPLLPPGVVLVFSPQDVDLRRDLSTAIGTQLAAARIAVITDEDTSQPAGGVRIVVGRKP